MWILPPSVFLDWTGARGAETGDQAAGDRGDAVIAGARSPDHQPPGGSSRFGEPAATCQD